MKLMLNMYIGAKGDVVFTVSKSSYACWQLCRQYQNSKTLVRFVIFMLYVQCNCNMVVPCNIANGNRILPRINKEDMK